MKIFFVDFREFRVNGLYLLQDSTLDLSRKATIAQSLVSAMFWHRRLGHVSDKGLRELSKQGMLGSEPLGVLKFCEHFIFGKQTKLRFYKGQHTTTHAFDYIYYDLWRHAPIQSLGKNRYFFSLVDDHTRRL